MSRGAREQGSKGAGQQCELVHRLMERVAALEEAFVLCGVALPERGSEGAGEQESGVAEELARAVKDAAETRAHLTTAQRQLADQERWIAGLEAEIRRLQGLTSELNVAWHAERLEYGRAEGETITTTGPAGRYAALPNDGGEADVGLTYSELDAELRAAAVHSPGYPAEDCNEN